MLPLLPLGLSHWLSGRCITENRPIEHGVDKVKSKPIQTGSASTAGPAGKVPAIDEPIQSPLAEKARTFQSLFKLSLLMSGDRSLEDNLLRVVDNCRQLAGTEMAMIALKEVGTDEMAFRSSVGVRTEAFRSLRFPIKGSIGGQVFEAREARAVLSYEMETGLSSPILDVVLAEGLVSGIVAPVQMGDMILGALYAFDRRRRTFSPDAVETLSLIGNMAAVEIHRQMVRGDLDRFRFELEKRVKNRTSRLSETNALLRREIMEREKAEIALRQSEERFREMTAHIREVFWLFDRDSRRVTYVSPAYESIWGRSISSLYHRYEEWLDSVYPDDREEAAASFNRLLSAGGGEAWEYRIVRPDGDVRWISDRGFPIRDDTGKVIRVAGIAEDITDRKIEEAENKKRRNLVESVLYHAPDAIVTLDDRHRVLGWNPGAERMFGYALEEALGKNLDDLVSREEMYEEACRNTQKVLSGKRIDAFETVRYRKDGTPIQVIASGSPIMGDDGLTGVVAVYTDISQLKAAEQALRESEEQLRAIFHTIPDPVTLVRLEDERFVDVNDAFLRLTGYTREEVVGRPPSALNLWQDSAERRRVVDDLIKKGDVGNVEARMLLKDGSVVLGLLSARLLGLNGIPHYITITRDITGLKAAQAEKEKLELQLRQAQKMEAVGTLAGGIAHDFNNLLMGIQGRSSLMLADISPDHPFNEHLAGIEAYVKRAADLTKQLLGFARGGKYEAKPLNPNELVAVGLSLFGRTHKEISIQADYQKHVWTVEADRRQIEQLLLNLYLNAWQAMPGGGSMVVKTRNVSLGEIDVKPYGLSAGPYVQLSVIDTGVGMDAGTQERIFDPFFTTKQMGGGSGLGLASAYGIAKNHGGFITVTSEMGKGSTFNVYLPASEHTPVSKPHRQTALVPGSETILLVDDERMILEVGRLMLERLGYQVLTANGGREALDRYDQDGHRISLVILDMIMPEMGGEETFDRLKAKNPNVAVLLSSGYSIEGQASDIIQKGCRGFIQKPFNMEALSNRLRAVFEG
ncbi:MAG: PAS domain S-box protein [Desulfobacterales bacterium]|jgi:PAS domain S-box-containing protein